jgi:cold shock CspA family protein
MGESQKGVNVNVLPEARRKKRNNMVGIVIIYDERKQWGFIRAHSAGIFGNEIFFHRSNCRSGVSLGEEVEFEIGKPFKIGQREQAVNVRLAVGVVDSVGGAQ